MRYGIYWLASYPKSGNTWMRIFLTNYLRVVESEDKDIDPNNLERTPIASARVLFDEITGAESGLFTPDEVDKYRPDVYRRWAESRRTALNEEGLMLSKVHDAYTYLPDGQPLFPVEATAGVIYIIRNPLDVAVSYSFHNSSDVENAINQMASYSHCLAFGLRGQPNQLRQKLLTWSGHVNSWNVPNIARLVVRYEDMTFKPLETFRAVVRFIGVEEDTERIEQSIEQSTFDNIKEKEEEVGFGEKPYKMEKFFRKGQVGNWREYLTPKQVGRIIHVHHRVMLQYGYLKPNGELVY